MPELVQTKISDKGRLVIPNEVRERLGMQVGDTVFLEVADNELRISTFASRLRRTQQRLQKYATPGKLASDALIDERRQEAKKEEEEAMQPGSAYGSDRRDSDMRKRG
jgi:AbrB family looped-hinge helix DNA binding protein